MQRFTGTFRNKFSVIGMIHLGALPGSPCYGGSLSKLKENAIKEAEIYKNCQVDGVLIENMHDVPYMQPKDMEPETVAMMTRICAEVREMLPLSIPCGAQVLAGGNKEAIAVALAAGLQFIRAEGYVFSHIADEGFTDAAAGTLLRYRQKVGAKNILVFTDVKKKHSAHSITADVSLQETIKAADFFLSDGVIVTGVSTGDPVNVSSLHDAKQSTNGPVIIGSGVTVQNVEKYYTANAVIVGSHFKKNGCWQNEVEMSRVQRFMEKVNELRKHC